MRSRHARAVSYRFSATFGLGNNFFRRGFAHLTAYWQRLEVPRGCPVELLILFSYRIMELLDRWSPCWVVAYTELSTKTAAFILFEFFDSCNLWALGKEIVPSIRRLDLRHVLRNASNVTECLSLLEAI